MYSLNKLECLDLAIGHSEDKILFSKIELKLFPGEVVCIMGANGVGKSTFLKTLSGQIPALQGSVQLNSKELSQYSQLDIARLVSIVQSSSPIFHPSLKVRELLNFSRSPYTSFWGKLRDEDQQIIDDISRKCEITSLLEREISSLSDGQRQKVMIARALVQQTPLILLDEPTTYLDLKNQISVLLLLKRLASEFQKTIVFTSHHWELILELATKVWYFDDEKKIIEETTPEDLILTQKWQSYLNLEIAQFDQFDGRFKLNACDAYPIMITGENSAQKKWTSHHLTKHGYYDVKNAELVCECIDQGWIIRKGPRTKRVLSILELIENIKSLSV